LTSSDPAPDRDKRRHYLNLRRQPAFGCKKTSRIQIACRYESQVVGDANEQRIPGNRKKEPDVNLEMNLQTLQRQNVEFLGTGGRSQENRSLGFRPAFMDQETSAVYQACFADGSPAPFHLLDGLPSEIVLSRTAQGRVASVKPTIVAGFTLDGQFYTREAAARKANELH